MNYTKNDLSSTKTLRDIGIYKLFLDLDRSGFITCQGLFNLNLFVTKPVSDNVVMDIV